MLKFISLFICTIPIIYIVDNTIQNVTNEKLISFILLHVLILPFIKDVRAIIWWLFTVVHGIAHIAHPAFYGLNVNPNYTPLYDYVIHGGQCLLIFYYHEKLSPLGIFGAIVMIIGSACAHFNPEFLDTKEWLFVSGFGVLGTLYHMMLINNKRDSTIFKANLIIWTAPYIGYIIPEFIPQWDSFVCSLGLFRLWFLAYFMTNYIYSNLKFLKVKID